MHHISKNSSAQYAFGRRMHDECMTGELISGGNEKRRERTVAASPDGSF
jgi:hypothetical protein